MFCFQAITKKEGRPYPNDDKSKFLHELSSIFASSKEEEGILKKPSTKFEDKFKLLETVESQETHWSEEQRAKFQEIKSRYNLEKLDTNLAGSEQEEEVFKKIRRALERLQVKDTVVVNGWNIKNKCEFDFLIVSEPLKAIFQLEVKQTYSKQTRKKGAEQLQKGKSTLQSIVHFLPDDWKYVGILYFAFDNRGKRFNLSTSQNCQNCQLFILGPETDFEAWWQELSSKLTAKKSTIFDRNTYIQIVQYLSTQMYKQRDCFTKQDLLHYTEDKIDKISTPENVFFWSKSQYPLLHDRRKKRMVFSSSFGTGKTVLLKAKAKTLLDYGQKVAFVFEGESPKETLLQMQYKEEFYELKNLVTFHHITCQGK